MTVDKNLTLDAKRYLEKIKLILVKPKLAFFDKRYLKKLEIEDLICCLEASFPEIFKKAIKDHKQSSLKSVRLYRNLTLALKLKKSKFFADCYVVSFKECYSLTEGLIKTIDSDIKKIVEDSTDMH